VEEMFETPRSANAVFWWVAEEQAERWLAGEKTDSDLLLSKGAALFIFEITGHTAGMRKLLQNLGTAPAKIYYRTDQPGLLRLATAKYSDILRHETKPGLLNPHRCRFDVNGKAYEAWTLAKIKYAH
jgi:hypothetical protein